MARPANDKRGNLRIKTRAWVRAEFGGEVRQIRDLSTTGVFVRLEHPAKLHSNVDIYLKSVRLPEPVKISGVVRRSIPGNGMGIEFTGFKGKGQLDLSELLSDLIVPRVLVSCHEEHVRRDLNRIFSKEGYAVIMAPDVEETLHLAEETQLDLILLDLDMPGKETDGLMLKMKAIKNVDNVPIVAMSESTDPSVLGHAQKDGATGTIPKPIKSQRLLNFIRMMLERS